MMKKVKKVIVHYQNPKHTCFDTGEMVHHKREFPSIKSADKWLNDFNQTAIINVRSEIIRE